MIDDGGDWRATVPVDSGVFGRRSTEKKRRPKHSVSMAHPLASKSRDQSRRARTGNTSRQQPRLHSPLCPHCTQTTAYTTPNKAWQTNTKNRKKGRKKKKGA